MSHARIAVILCCTLAGCSSTGNSVTSSVAALKKTFSGEKKDEPVDSSTASTASSKPDAQPAAKFDGTIQTASATETTAKPIGEVAESIVARVNGDVILNQDLFNPIRGQLMKAQQEMKPAEFAQYRSVLIQKQLRDLIERQLLIQEAKKTIPEMGIKRLESIADKEFGKRIEAEMKRMEVNTEAELRRKMMEQGESLDQFREFQRGTFIAQQYLRMQLAPKLDVSREEMMDYYNLHGDLFKKESAVRWSENFVSFEKYGSRENALTKANQLLANLRGGSDFSELAKKESEGATAAQGGAWELTTKGSYIVAAVDQAIFSLPAGRVSDPVEGPKGWHIVRVDESQPGGQTSFVDAQDEVRKAIREQKITKESQRYVQELAQKAQITTIFNTPSQSK